MLKAVAALTEALNVPCQVSLEERMGCGVGACLVCGCRTLENGQEHMRRVCKDGPVFNAKEVVW
jgi:dihydroorotate dehydrogenase electron transfer subunit